jgi:hypothetical protein
LKSLFWLTIILYAFFTTRYFRRLFYRLQQKAAKKLWQSSTWWSLRVSELRVGDIIGTSCGKQGKLIRKLTGGGPLSHVALYVGQNRIIEAVLPRARQKPASTFVLSRGEPDFYVLRPKPDVLHLDREPLRAEALRAEAGYWMLGLYSLVKAAGVVLPRVRDLAARDATICSQLIIEAYKRAGVDLCPNLALGEVSPNSIYRSKLLEDATMGCSKKITEPEFYLASNFFAVTEGPLVYLQPLKEWLGALIWSLNPARHAWATPVSSWSGLDFWSSYLSWFCLVAYRWVRANLLIAIVGLMRVSPPWALPSLVSESTETLRALIQGYTEKIEDLKQQLSQALQTSRSIVDYMPAAHPRWRTLVDQLERRDCAVGIKEATHYIRNSRWILARMKAELARKESSVRQEKPSGGRKS